MLGTVKWFDSRLGYGFIKPDDQEKDVFVYYKNISASGYKKLEEAERVEFEIAESPRGPTAINVLVIGKKE
jgi:CspA family cold shock protein